MSDKACKIIAMYINKKVAWRQYLVKLHMLTDGTNPFRQHPEMGELAGVAFFMDKIKWLD